MQILKYIHQFFYIHQITIIIIIKNGTGMNIYQAFNKSK